MNDLLRIPCVLIAAARQRPVFPGLRSPVRSQTAIRYCWPSWGLGTGWRLTA